MSRLAMLLAVCGVVIGIWLSHTLTDSACHSLQSFSDDGNYLIYSFRHSAICHSGDLIWLVTHMTMDRMHHVVRWCEQWQGPISLSVFVRPNETVQRVIARVLNSSCLSRNANIHLVVHRVQNLSRMDMMSNYPFNVQRNAALNGALGDLVFLVDIDFGLKPTNTTARIMTEHVNNIAGTKTPAEGLLVVPAVETISSEIEPPGTIPELLSMLQEHHVCDFYGHYCKACHLPTNVNHFVRSSLPYPVVYDEGYEPYVIARRYSLPRYNESFVGRGWDKMSFFYELNFLRRAFYVLPSFFLVHSGRGDMPSLLTKEYRDKQRENQLLMQDFKRHLSLRQLENPAARRQFLSQIQWRDVSTMAGVEKCCLLKAGTGKEQGILDFACSHVDCKPLQEGGVRYYPRNVSLAANWAIERYWRDAVSQRNETEEIACHFDGSAQLVPCGGMCFFCEVINEPTTDESLTFLCDEHRLNNCDALYRQFSISNNKMLKLSFLLTFFSRVVDEGKGECYPLNGVQVRQRDCHE